MKKKILGIIAFATIAAVAVWNYNQNMNNVNLSDLALENVEALADGESGSNTYEYVIPGTYVACVCYGSGSLSCC